MTDPERIAAGLSEHDRLQLRIAGLADSQEYWTQLPTNDPRLASDDCVLTPLGLQVRTILQGKDQ